MHKILAYVCGAVLLVLPLQPAAGQVNVAIGVKGGLNISDVSVDPEDPADVISTRKALVAGAAFSIGVHDAFAIQPELLYSQGGAKLADAADPTTAATIETAYFAIPLLAKVMVPIERSKVRPIFYVGPSLGIRLTCNVTGELGGTSISVDCDDPLVGIALKTVNFSILGGAGLEIDAGPALVTLEGRYDYGLSDIDEDALTTAKTRVITIMGGVSFKLPR